MSEKQIKQATWSGFMERVPDNQERIKVMINLVSNKNYEFTSP